MKNIKDIMIFRENPSLPPKGIVIRRRVKHSRVGIAWMERGVTLNKGFLTSTEAAAYLNVSLRRIYQLIEEGKLKPSKRGNQLQFQLKTLVDFEESRKGPGRPKSEAFLVG